MTKQPKIPLRLLGLGMLVLSACASFPPPTESMQTAISAVRGAEEVGAADVPRAALMLQLAREEVAKAQKLLAAGENEAAHFQALRASNDADLAISFVREDEARATAKQAEHRVEQAEGEVTP